MIRIEAPVRLAIEELVFEFARRIDHDSAVDNELLFAHDAYFEYDGRSNEGRADIRAAYDARRARGERTARHVFTNLVIQSDDRGRLFGSSIMLLFGADGPPPIDFAAPIVVADVEDEYVLIEDKYLFARRVITPIFVEADRPAILPLGAHHD